jgi:hypothetical protein
MIEFQPPHPPPSPFLTGLRGVAHDPGNLNHLAFGYVEPPPRLAEPRTTPWHRTTVSTFDQMGSNCTWEAANGVAITLPFRYAFQPYRSAYDTEVERHQAYLDAQAYDPWPGGEPDYLGSSTDAPYRLLRERGIITGWDWLLGEEQLWEWVSFYAPASAGTLWTEGMFYTEADGYVHPTGRMDWGHAYEIIFASHPRQAYRIVNSWGIPWGEHGRAWISRPEMKWLLENDGEAATIKLLTVA